jgi:hypothetical protein
MYQRAESTARWPVTETTQHNNNNNNKFIDCLRKVPISPDYKHTRARVCVYFTVVPKCPKAKV